MTRNTKEIISVLCLLLLFIIIGRACNQSPKKSTMTIHINIDAEGNVTGEGIEVKEMSDELANAILTTLIQQTNKTNLGGRGVAGNSPTEKTN